MLGLVSRPLRFNALQEQSYPRRRVSSGSRRAAFDDGYNPATNEYTPVLGEPTTVSGFRLVDGRASYGIGLQTSVIGIPLHFDWSWRTLFNENWEDLLFATEGGSAFFRRPRFDFWMGFDF